jgi:hypothetical protein
MRVARISSDEFAPNTRLMSLEGAEAVELYLAGIDRNVDSINEQIALLQMALAERKELLRELDAGRGEKDELPRQIDSSQTSPPSRDK